MSKNKKNIEKIFSTENFQFYNLGKTCILHGRVFVMFQFMSEKIGGAKGTELDDEFVEMERVSRQCQGPEVIKLFSCSTQLRLEFILLINVKMPTIVGILTFMSRINY